MQSDDAGCTGSRTRRLAPGVPPPDRVVELEFESGTTIVGATAAGVGVGEGETTFVGGVVAAGAASAGAAANRRADRARLAITVAPVATANAVSPGARRRRPPPGAAKRVELGVVSVSTVTQ
ncbi:hypothetical protein GCM10025780_13940 [Frondihabitans cladoniiphilus]|uniref:Uncharacterized protein n=1 Tax=Frondihabitans cladoniiphilus TaxID=715785 RepID=A0ABP8VVQ6_9MICO